MSKYRLVRGLILALVTIPVVCVLQAVDASAANQVVTNNNDSGAGSFRQALLDVGSGEEITFDDDYTITLASQLTIGKNLAITGRGAAQTIIQANASPDTATYRVLEISSGNTVTLSGMTIRHGGTADAGWASNADHGGGILNAGTLTIEDCIINYNHTGEGGDNSGMFSVAGTGGYGAGLYSTGSLTISGSTFSNNTTGKGGDSGGGTGSSRGQGGDGAGLYFSGTSTSISDSTFSDNTTGPQGTGGQVSSTGGSGAGLYHNAGTMTIDDCALNDNTSRHTGGGVGNSGTLNITNTTISGNTDTNSGGGISSGGTLTISNSTVSGNSHTGFSNGGGGFYCYTNSATVSSCTIANNSADSSNGGGIYLSSGTLVIKNSIIANNSSAGTADFHKASGTLTNNGYNAVESQNGSDFVNGASGCITGVTCGTNLSASLADHGGPTLTLALSSGSPAIDTIPQDTSGSGGGDTYNGCSALDQRSHTRPSGTGTTNNRDMGAYEFNAPLLVDLVSFTATGGKEYIRLRWETASELHNIGFHIWRSVRRDGGYVRITDELIPAEGGPAWGAVYTCDDWDVSPGQAYFYQLEDIDDTGSSHFHGPTVAWIGKLDLKKKK